MKIPPAAIKGAIIETLRTLYDPEIHINIYDLGLIYDVSVTEEGDAHILMTLTTPMCPVAESLPIAVKERALMVEGVASANVEITWNPPWDVSKIDEAGRLQLNL